MPWIEAEFEMTHKTATNFMNVAAKFGGKVETVSTLGLTALYELASSTADIQAEVERRIAAGEIIGAADVKTTMLANITALKLKAEKRLGEMIPGSMARTRRLTSSPSMSIAGI